MKQYLTDCSYANKLGYMLGYPVVSDSTVEKMRVTSIFLKESVW